MSFDIIHKPTNRKVTINNLKDFLYRKELYPGWEHPCPAYFFYENADPKEAAHLWENTPPYIIDLAVSQTDKRPYLLYGDSEKPNVMPLPSGLFEVRLL